MRSKKPCDICEKHSYKNTVEPHFGYVSCPEHRDVPPVEKYNRPLNFIIPDYPPKKVY